MYEIAGAFILGLVCGLLGYVWISAPDRRRAADRAASLAFDRDTARAERDYWRDTYHNSVGRLITAVHGAENATYWKAQFETNREQWEQELRS